MSKTETLNHIFNQKGFIQFNDLFNLFDENEKIPQYLIEAELNGIKPINDGELMKLLMNLI